MEKNNIEKSEKKDFKKVKIIATIVAIVIVLGLIAYTLNTIVKKQNFSAQNPVATIEIKDLGTIKVELYPSQAPETVANFVKLANNGFYDGLVFHRTIPDFMIQGGDVNGDGTGNATQKDLGKESEDKYTIKGEFIANGVNNTIKHKRGVISMARGDYSAYSSTLVNEGYNSASSQFFITTTDQTANLDGIYAAFGEVIEGMDVVDKIANLEVETREEQTSSESELTKDRPVNPPVISSIRVDTYGIDYGMPKTKEPFNINSWYMSQMYGNSNY